MQQFLPLAHHAHILVVEDEDLDRQPILHRRRHLLHVHQDRGLAGDVDHQRLRMRRAARRSPPAGRSPSCRGRPRSSSGSAPRSEMLRRPHLVLADLGGDVGVAVLGQLVEPLDRVLRLDDLRRNCGSRTSCARASRRSALHQSASAAASGWRGSARHSRTMSSSTCAQSPTMPRSTLTFLLIEDGSMSMWIFFGLRREGVEPAGDAIVEARADADHQIAIVHRVVGFERCRACRACRAIACRKPDRRRGPSGSR